MKVGLNSVFFVGLNLHRGLLEGCSGTLADMTAAEPTEADIDDTVIRGVVVGYDGSPAADLALDWAAAAAAAHGLPLTLLAAQPDAEGEVIDVPDVADSEVLDEDLAVDLGHATDRVAQTYPDLELAVVVHPEAPVVGILDASRTAEVVVLGSRGMGGFQGLLLGSTTMNVAPYAECPVVVLYEPDERTAEAVANARHPEEIVVGFDGSEYAVRALEFALQHAVATGLGLAVVAVSKGRSGEPPAQVNPDDADLPESVRENLQAAAEVAQGYPDVEISYLHGVGRPAVVLIHEAAGSALAVVGVRGRGGFATLRLGSVGMQMLIHAECPVALVREVHEAWGGSTAAE